MFRKTLAFMTAFAAAACMFVSCGKPKLEGKYELCTKEGIELDIALSFKDEGRMKINDERCRYEVIDSDTIEISETDDKYFSDIFDFKIVDKEKKLMYIEDVSEKFEKNDLDALSIDITESVNIGICHLYDEGIDIYNCIICSDETKNVFDDEAKEPDLQVERIKQIITKCFKNGKSIDNYDYMLVIRDGACDLTAVARKGGKNISLSHSNYICESIDKVTLDEYYENYKSQIK